MHVVLTGAETATGAEILARLVTARDPHDITCIVPDPYGAARSVAEMVGFLVEIDDLNPATRLRWIAGDPLARKFAVADQDLWRVFAADLLIHADPFGNRSGESAPVQLAAQGPR